MGASWETMKRVTEHKAKGKCSHPLRTHKIFMRSSGSQGHEIDSLEGQEVMNDRLTYETSGPQGL